MDLAERQHDVVLKGRKDLSLTGVEKVDTFDEHEVVVITSLGSLSIQGQALHIRHLDLEKGDMHLDGQVESLAYREGQRGKRKGLLGRITR